jgi:hypothetical protein
LILIVFFQLFMTWHAASAPLLEIIRRMQEAEHSEFRAEARPIKRHLQPPDESRVGIKIAFFAREAACPNWPTR